LKLENLNKNKEDKRVRDYEITERRNEQINENSNGSNSYQGSESCEIEVYNRWGTKVTSLISRSLDPDNVREWNDLIKKSNWNPQDGTYFYSMVCSGAKKSGTIIKKGEAYTIK